MADTIELFGSYSFDNVEDAITAQNKFRDMKVEAVLDLDRLELKLHVDIVALVPTLLGFYDQQNWQLIKNLLRVTRRKKNLGNTYLSDMLHATGRAGGGLRGGRR